MMKLKIVDEKDNPVLERKELKVEVDFEGGATPKLADVGTEVAKSRGADNALVEVTNLFSLTGSPRGLAKVRIWNSAEAREKVKAHKRGEKAKEEKKEEKPKEEKKEAPAEAPKEEKPAEKPEKKKEEKPAEKKE